MAQTYDRPFIIGAAVTGVGLSGFFDGILLHQVLQWHHLLSLVPGEALRDLRTQILADGLFHVLMYAVTAAGLGLMWRARTRAAASSGRAAAGGLLLGFGLWNVIDVGGFHWVLGIHRIRVDVPDPLLYDLAWLALFGLVPLILARFILRGRPQSRGGTFAPLAIAAAALAGGVVAARPVTEVRSAVVLLPAGSSPAAAFATARAAGTPLLWADPAGGLMIVRADPGADARLYASGAWWVTRSPALAGCFTALA